MRHRQGRLTGHMEALGFGLRQDADLQTLTADVLVTVNPDSNLDRLAKVYSLRDQVLVAKQLSVHYRPLDLKWEPSQMSLLLHITVAVHQSHVEFREGRE